MSSRRRAMMTPKADSDILWLYNEGDECTSVTGGWSFPTIYQTSSLFDANADGRATLTRTKNQTNITIAYHTSELGRIPTVSVHTNNSLDLSAYSKLHVEFVWSSTHSSGAGRTYLFEQLPDHIQSTINGNVITSYSAQGLNHYVGNLTVTNGYVTIWILSWSGSAASSSGDFSLQINKVWLEK